MPSLSPEEQALWARVTESIQPLSRDPLPAKAAAAATTKPPPAPPRVRGRVPPPRPAPSAVPASARGHGVHLDGSWDRKLDKGSVEPDRILDLHGHDLDSAWGAIDTALERAIAAGDRVLLLITGHHRSGEPPVQRGRIRAAVHHWLAASRHAPRIAAVRGAHRRHGGGGSLYIVLRRPQLR